MRNQMNQNEVELTIIMSLYCTHISPYGERAYGKEQNSSWVPKKL